MRRVKRYRDVYYCIASKEYIDNEPDSLRAPIYRTQYLYEVHTLLLKDSGNVMVQKRWCLALQIGTSCTFITEKAAINFIVTGKPIAKEWNYFSDLLTKYYENKLVC